MDEQQDAREQGETGNDGANPYVIPVSIVIAGLLIAGAVFYSGRSGAPAPSEQKVAAGTAAAGAAAADLADDDPFLGDPAAPVIIVEFADFQCPFCRKFWKETLPQIKKDYLLTGKAMFVYRDFPLAQIHPGAMPAAQGAECAKEQGAFWEMHDVIFEEQEKQGSGTIQFTADDVKKWAGKIGLNAAVFNACLDSGKYASEVQKDFSDGQALGVSGTPATFVNGRLISGAQPFAQFAAIIEEELAKARQ